MDTGSNEKLNRRALLAGAVFLLGGAAALMRFSRPGGGNGGGKSVDDGPVLSAEQFALLEQVCEVIIPTTDTPGAIGAGVPAFMRQILEDWGTENSRTEIGRASCRERV